MSNFSSSFGIGTSTNYITIPQYSTAFSNLIYVSSILGFNSPISLNASISPAQGYTGTWIGNFSFNTTSLTPPNSTSFTLAPVSSTPGILYKTQVWGTSGGFSSGTTINVFVVSSNPQAIGLSVVFSSGPINSITLYRGSLSQTYTAKIYPIIVQSYPNNVTLSVSLSDYLTHASASLGATSIGSGFTKGNPASTSLQLSVNSSAPLGQFVATLVANDYTSNPPTTANANLLVTVAPNSSISTVDGPETTQSQAYKMSLVPYIDSNNGFSDYSLGSNSAYWNNLYVKNIHFAGSISGGAAGSGTPNTIAMWTTDGSTLGNSGITESGGREITTNLTITGNFSYQGNEVMFNKDIAGGYAGIQIGVTHSGSIKTNVVPIDNVSIQTNTTTDFLSTKTGIITLVLSSNFSTTFILNLPTGNQYVTGPGLKFFATFNLSNTGGGTIDIQPQNMSVGPTTLEYTWTGMFFQDQLGSTVSPPIMSSRRNTTYNLPIANTNYGIVTLTGYIQGFQGIPPQLIVVLTGSAGLQTNATLYAMLN